LTSALTTHTYSNTREKKKKKKKKRTNKKKLQQAIESQTKAKNKDHLKKTSLGPLRQGQWLDTSETKLCLSKERKPPTKARKPQRAPAAHMQAPAAHMQALRPIRHNKAQKWLETT
jgi:hypothetical protein